MTPDPLRKTSTFSKPLLDGYRMPQRREGRPTTRLWHFAEEVAKVTGTPPERWLRYGEQRLEWALAALRDATGVRNPGAWVTWRLGK